MEERNGTLDAKLAAAIDAIDPAGLGYDDWIVLMGAMKDAGISYADVDAWNRRDPERYDERANRRHWDSLNNPTSPQVAEATIFKAASANGWRWHGPSAATTCTSTENQPTPRTKTVPEYPVLALDGVTAEAVEPPDLSPADQIREQLAAMFYQGETVNTFVEGPTWNEKQGKWQPIGWGEFSGVDLFWMDGYTETVLGSANPEAGAWVRVNPMDGCGGSDGNVTAYRHVLVESDSLPAAEQMAAYLRLNLPCSAIVDSGNKSVHAFVRVDADGPDQYRERVSWLYGFLRANGLEVDAANRNPARWARLAGVTRNGLVQRLMATHAGAKSWDEWRAWVDTNATSSSTSAEKGEKARPRATFEDACDFLDEPPEHVPVLIDGLLHRGHVMGIVGSAGIGKSWMLIELAVSIAIGGDWMGFPCKRGEVVFVNPEIDAPNLRNRIRSVCQRMGVGKDSLGHRVKIMNLRGQAMDIDGIRTELAGMGECSAILLDSIYMLSDADENAAGEVKDMFSSLMALAREHNASVVFTHHTGKGSTGARTAKDRARGSSVFVGAPDTVLTLDPLDVDPDGAAWQLLRLYDRDEGGRRIWASAWRLTAAKMRAWPTPSPVDLIYSWPTHRRDITGELAECEIVGTPKSWGKQGGEKNAARAKELAERQADALDQIIEQATRDGNVPTRAYCLPRFNAAREDMGLDPVSKGTFAIYTRPGGMLPHRVASDGSNALERPDDDSE